MATNENDTITPDELHRAVNEAISLMSAKSGPANDGA